MVLNVVLEKTLESPLDCKEIQPVHPKENQSWIFIGRTNVEAENSNTLASWFEEPIPLKRPWCWERLKGGGEGYDRGWDGWMASLMRWTWVWVNSRSWWVTGRPGVLQSTGSQRVGDDWVIELNWTENSWKRKSGIKNISIIPWGFTGDTGCKESSCQCQKCKRWGFDSGVRKIPLEEEMAAHSSILAWKIWQTEEPGPSTVHGVAESNMTYWLNNNTIVILIS